MFARSLVLVALASLGSIGVAMPADVATPIDPSEASATNTNKRASIRFSPPAFNPAILSSVPAASAARPAARP